MYSDSLYPPTIVYGSKMPDLRLRSHGGRQIYFCRKNRNLHLSDEDFNSVGTYEVGRFLAELCREFCAPKRAYAEPCPAFVTSHKVFTEDKSLATVVAQKTPRLDNCLGVQQLVDIPDTPEERFFLRAYLDEHATDEHKWRSELLDEWNEYCGRVDDSPFDATRREKFDNLMWATLRYPALIPQVWLNWLASAGDEHMKVLDENPSRVDFVAFYERERYLIEIDGPSHYAAYNEVDRTYTIDEREYARNLKIARSLQRDGWNLTRIGRVEVRDAMADHDDDFIESILRRSKLMRIVPYQDRQNYPGHQTFTDLGVYEIDVAIANEIPF